MSVIAGLDPYETTRMFLGWSDERLLKHKEDLDLVEVRFPEKLAESEVGRELLAFFLEVTDIELARRNLI